MNPDNMELSKLRNSVVIITAAGSGKRFGSKLSKQYHQINGKTVLDITLSIFFDSEKIDKIILMVSPDDDSYSNSELISNDKMIVIDGGEQRQQTVNNGLRYLYDNGLPDSTPVLVHDAVRPCLSSRDLDSLLNQFRENEQACFLAEAVTDSLKKVDQDGMVVQNVNRDNYLHALTPQIARFIDLKHALSRVLQSGIVVTDEISALTDCDIAARAVIAKDPNPKITYPKDLLLAEKILASRSVE